MPSYLSTPRVSVARATLTTSTATQIVAAVAGQQIYVLGYSVQSSGSNTPAFNFQDNADTPNVLSRVWELDATGAAGVQGVICPPSPLGCGVAKTATGKALMGKLDTTGTVVVEVTYITEDA